MAERRMFSKSVVNAARFLRMPLTAQALYFHLGVQADDDGIVEAFTVMRMTSANEDDLNVLVSKGFISILNDDLVSYITDWKTNNYIQKDRYHESRYKQLLVCVQSVSESDTGCIQSVSETDTQVRLGKGSIGQYRIGGGAAEPPKGFAPPSFSELSDYCSNEGLVMDCQHFIDYYEARGWMLSGGAKMSDWKAATRSWAKRELDATTTVPGNGIPTDEDYAKGYEESCL